LGTRDRSARTSNVTIFGRLSCPLSWSFCKTITYWSLDWIGRRGYSDSFWRSVGVSFKWTCCANCSLILSNTRSWVSCKYSAITCFWALVWISNFDRWHDNSSDFPRQAFDIKKYGLVHTRKQTTWRHSFVREHYRGGPGGTHDYNTKH
jgi:hypothetical protein